MRPHDVATRAALPLAQETAPNARNVPEVKHQSGPCCCVGATGVDEACRCVPQIIAHRGYEQRAQMSCWSRGCTKG